MRRFEFINCWTYKNMINVLRIVWGSYFARDKKDGKIYFICIILLNFGFQWNIHRSQ